MARNYVKEREWQSKKYDRITANIDKDLGIKLRAKLQKENKTVASWVKDNAEQYLHKDEV